MINLSELLDRAKKKALEKPDDKNGYAPKSTDELRFVRKHVRVTKPDANGNGDDVFKGTNIKSVERQPNHGYNPGEDEEVYEEVTKTCKECGKKYTGKQCSCCTTSGKAEGNQIDEISDRLKDKYINQAAHDAVWHAQSAGRDAKPDNPNAMHDLRTVNKRLEGIKAATRGKVMGKYINQAAHDAVWHAQSAGRDAKPDNPNAMHDLRTVKKRLGDIALATRDNKR